MSRNLIASKLIESVRNRAMIPDDITVYDDESVLAILNEEIDVGLLDTLMTLFEDNITTHIDVPLTEGRSYIIPHRAVGNKLRDLTYVDGHNTYELARIDISELPDYQYDDGYTGEGTDVFYVEGDEVVLINPRFRDHAKLRMHFHIRPNYIVLEEKCAQITSINRTTGLIQFNTIPKEFTGLLQADFIQNKSPNKILGIEIPVTNVSISTRSLVVDPSQIPSRLQVGDWVCFPEQSPFPNVPTELHPVLAQRAAVHILEAIGDSESLGAALRKLNQMEKSVQKIIDDRVEGSPRKIKNRFGTLHSQASYRQRTNRGRL